MAEALTALSGQIANIVVGVLEKFGVAMTLRRVTTYPSDRTEPTTETEDFPCRGVGGIVDRQYGKDNAMSRVLEITITDPGTEPRAGDVLFNADGSTVAVILPNSVKVVKPDFVTKICYLITLRQA